MKRYRSDDEIEPYYRNLVVRNIPNTIPDPDVVDCLYQEYRKYGKCKVSQDNFYLKLNSEKNDINAHLLNACKSRTFCTKVLNMHAFVFFLSERNGVIKIPNQMLFSQQSFLTIVKIFYILNETALLRLSHYRIRQTKAQSTPLNE